MLQYLIMFVFLLNGGRAGGNLCVTNVIVRMPRENDIGLIFDLTVSNSVKNEKRETLDFTVASDGECTVNTTQGELVHSMGRIFGGDFGAIEPGKSETVSLVWPTVSLYNRVGSCPILITATSAQDSMASTKQLLHFDTRIETLDPNSHTLRKRKDFVDCRNWDKDYFRNCTPLNCEERYFGQRSFYNHATEQCDRVHSSSRPGEFYDIYSNEAIDRNNFVTDKELEEIKQGKFDSNYLDLQGPPADLMDAKKDTAMEKKLHKKSPLENSLLTQLYYDWYLPLRAENVGEFSGIEDGAGAGAGEGGATSNSEIVSSSSETLVDWPSKLDGSGCLLLVLKGFAIILSLIMFQILVTLTAYFVVCISVYGFIELYGLWKSREDANDLFVDSMSRSSPTEVFTTESLMSHR